MKIFQAFLGELDGKRIMEYKVINDAGMEVTCLNYGCTITSIFVPDRYGKKENVVLGFDSVAEYREHSPYFGSVIGRHAGRIKDGSLPIDGVTYRLARNNLGNHLHGGIKGFDKVVWDVSVSEAADSISIRYSRSSGHLEEGYPGEVDLKVIYTITNGNEIILTYEGESDRRTILNLTNHTYFNLSGDLKNTIKSHRLTVNSDQFLELDESLMPTGQAVDVEGTVFDFRKGRVIDEGIISQHPQNLLAGNGYDHPFLLRESNFAAIVLEDDESGRRLTIETNQPAVILYTGNQLEDDFYMRGKQSGKYLGLCLETQGIPDAIHHPQFPATLVDKGERYTSVTKWRFGTID
ncbi:aldose epimerase family protein [Peribacillus sp. SI8-4]|uniref:aldose epimerase family protein n=1 Tax=Peribacillus sp. SI8-4 TaxID=3048009 RepID=UPI00255538E7|nr:aldose epimerase family protein [Peribacillus sp. SI8-4]